MAGNVWTRNSDGIKPRKQPTGPGKQTQTGPGNLFRNNICSRCTIGCKNIGTRTETMTRWGEGGVGGGRR